MADSVSPIPHLAVSEKVRTFITEHLLYAKQHTSCFKPPSSLSSDHRPLSFLTRFPTSTQPLRDLDSELLASCVLLSNDSAASASSTGSQEPWCHSSPVFWMEQVYQGRKVGPQGGQLDPEPAGRERAALPEPGAQRPSLPSKHSHRSGVQPAGDHAPAKSRAPEFDFGIWFRAPASCQGRSWEAAVMAQGVGFRPPNGRPGSSPRLLALASAEPQSWQASGEGAGRWKLCKALRLATPL
nr:uncharacterized protein LOC127484626 isoform X1 [Oryctolagus cuniculus]